MAEVLSGMCDQKSGWPILMSVHRWRVQPGTLQIPPILLLLREEPTKYICFVMGILEGGDSTRSTREGTHAVGALNRGSGLRSVDYEMRHHRPVPRKRLLLNCLFLLSLPLSNLSRIVDVVPRVAFAVPDS